jgi:carbonic anhydrase/acetyltransferase-like protein (isoleucine patch superfamily)
MTLRQPKGISTGGQFAPDVNQESTVDLSNIGDVVTGPAHQMPEGFAVADWRDVAGTALLDEVNTTYDDLVRTFGEPQFSDLKGLEGDKNTTEWYLETPSGVAHIYDYDDVEGRPLGQFDWHVGGFDIDVVEDIKNEINLRNTYGPATDLTTSHHYYDFGKGLESAHQHANGGGWVADTVHVEPSVFVGPDAKVCDYAQVTGGARLSGHAVVMDRAVVCDNALIVDAVVMDDATVSGEARVLDRAAISDRAWVAGFASVHGDAVLIGDARVLDHARIYDHAVIGGHAVVKDNATVFENATVRDSARVNGNARVCGEAAIYENATLGANAIAVGRAEAHGTTVISGSTILAGGENYPGRTQERE